MSTANEAIQKHHEIEQGTLVLDPRSFWSRFWDSLQKPGIPLIWGLISVPIILLSPATTLIMLFIQFILWLAVVSKPDTLPIHLPMEAAIEDENDPKPGDNNGFYRARGSFYLGRLTGSGYELWVSFKSLCQHFLIFGTTGSGKTESIVSYIVNYLACGSGVAFQDAKAAPKAMIQMATFCRIFGRDDDFRVTNYITGNTAEKRDPAERMSNDAAIFARGSAESNTQLLTSLLPPSDGDNKIFQERAVALVSAVMPALKELQLQSKVQIDPSSIRKFMSFQEFAELYRNNHISMRSRNALLAYLESLPGFDENKEVSKQNEEVTRQFGFAQAYFTRSLASLSDTYGHIYLTSLGEIDYQDAVLNGRILMTLLPSMEKSGDELSNLGKIVLTATRGGMVVGLGTVFEGSADDIVHNLPTNSDIPYGVINDENAYMLVEGQEMINAQARGLGFGVITGTQDAPGMLENISRTTKQIMANSAFKQIMYLDDKETTELACDLSGEANVLVRGRYVYRGDVGNVYSDDAVNVERRRRIEPSALKRLKLGQAFLMYQGQVHLSQVFNHGIQEKAKDPTKCYVKNWFPVRMAKVRLPDEAMFETLKQIGGDMPAWRDLQIMLSDDSRILLKEMTIYFQSMLRLSQIANSYKNNPELLKMMEDAGTTAAGATYEHDEDTMVGVLADIAKAPPKTIADARKLIEHIAEDASNEEVALTIQAQDVGLTMEPDDDDEWLPVSGSSDDDDDSGGSGGGGGGIRPSTDKSQEQPDEDLLTSFLGSDDTDSGTSPAVAGADQQVDDAGDAEDDAIEQYDFPADSALAQAVENNLMNMPWLATPKEYHETRNALIEVESFFTEDKTSATTAVDADLSLLGDSLVYPETPIKPMGIGLETARELLAPLLLNNPKK